MKHLAIILAVLTSASAFAYDDEVCMINYNIRPEVKLMHIKDDLYRAYEKSGQEIGIMILQYGQSCTNEQIEHFKKEYNIKGDIYIRAGVESYTIDPKTYEFTFLMNFLKYNPSVAPAKTLIQQLDVTFMGKKRAE